MFAVATGFGQGIRATTVDVVDVGVHGLYNLTGHSVRVLGVNLVSVPAALHLRSVTAYTTQQGSVGIIHWDLLKFCRKADPPYPVTDAVTAPHADSNWQLVLAITFTKPGRYYLGRVKIRYTTNGQRGWQYQNLFATIIVTAARPGTKPSSMGADDQAGTRPHRHRRAVVEAERCGDDGPVIGWHVKGPRHQAQPGRSADLPRPAPARDQAPRTRS